MSLHSVLHTARRAKVPENVLAQCRAADRAVVENIMAIVQEEIPTLDITRSALTHEGGAYYVSVPSAKPATPEPAIVSTTPCGVALPLKPSDFEYVQPTYSWPSSHPPYACGTAGFDGGELLTPTRSAPRGVALPDVNPQQRTLHAE